MGTLHLICTFPIRRLPNDEIVLTRKYVDAVARFAAGWSGGVVVVAPIGDASGTGNLDDVVFGKGELPFNVRWMPKNFPATWDGVLRNDVVLIAPCGDTDLEVAREARRRGAAVVFVLEYTPAVRTELARLHTGWFAWAKRSLWAKAFEKRCLSEFRFAAGLQCNGAATYEQYRNRSWSTMMFFDNRVGAELIVEDMALRHRLERMIHGSPLRLVFSGRLLDIKGVPDLVEVSDLLRARGVAFEMDIFGDGPMRSAMARDIAGRGLSDQVRLRGCLDFASELMPTIAKSADIFVCCHLQGDPSCTYVETMACGVPIIGYANSAWKALATASDAGWVTPTRNPLKMATRICALAQDRLEIERASWNARSFAVQHRFAETMGARLRHLKSCTTSAT